MITATLAQPDEQPPLTYATYTEPLSSALQEMITLGMGNMTDAERRVVAHCATVAAALAWSTQHALPYYAQWGMTHDQAIQLKHHALLLVDLDAQILLLTTRVRVEQALEGVRKIRSDADRTWQVMLLALPAERC